MKPKDEKQFAAGYGCAKVQVQRKNNSSGKKEKNFANQRELMLRRNARVLWSEKTKRKQ
jgi:hypothetical protein